METKTKDLAFYIKWLATVVLITGTIVAACGFTPYNFIFASIGCVLWTTVGVLWNDKSIIVMNVFLGSLSVVAYFNNGIENVMGMM